MKAFVLPVVAVMALAGHAAGQVVNGNFENGTLDGWEVANTPNGSGAPGSVVVIDIDGPGPLTDSLAATFMVGNAVPMSGNQAGIEMIQGLSLTAGVEYRFEFDWSAQRLSTTNNAEGGVFSLIVDGNIIESQAAGDVSATLPKYGHLVANFTPSTTATYRVGVRITRPYTVPGDLSEYVDNFTMSGGGPAPCYANCDGSTSAPILNVNDFICFQTNYAAGNPSANCDGSTAEPVLNVNDFICFQSAFAAGCP